MTKAVKEKEREMDRKKRISRVEMNIDFKEEEEKKEKIAWEVKRLKVKHKMKERQVLSSLLVCRWLGLISFGYGILVSFQFKSKQSRLVSLRVERVLD